MDIWWLDVEHLNYIAHVYARTQWQTAVFALIVLYIDGRWKSAHPRLRMLWWGAVLVKAIIPAHVVPPVFASDAVHQITQTALYNRVMEYPPQEPAQLTGAAILMFASLLAGCAVTAISLVRQMQLRVVLRDAMPVEVDGWDGRFPVFVSDRIHSPLTYGWLHPRIYLTIPIAEGDPAARLAILEHECAHAESRDNITLLVQVVVLALNALNPCVWFAVRHLSQNREEACDLVAIEHSGIGRTSYADALLTIAAGESALTERLPVISRLLESHEAFRKRLHSLLAPREVPMRPVTARARTSALLMVGALFFPVVSSYTEQPVLTRKISTTGPFVMHDEVDTPPRFILRWDTDRFEHQLFDTSIVVNAHISRKGIMSSLELLQGVPDDDYYGISWEGTRHPKVTDSLQLEIFSDILNQSVWAPAIKNNVAVDADICMRLGLHQYRK